KCNRQCSSAFDPVALCGGVGVRHRLCEHCQLVARAREYASTRTGSSPRSWSKSGAIDPPVADGKLASVVVRRSCWFGDPLLGERLSDQICAGESAAAE